MLGQLTGDEFSNQFGKFIHLRDSVRNDLHWIDIRGLDGNLQRLNCSIQIRRTVRANSSAAVAPVQSQGRITVIGFLWAGNRTTRVVATINQKKSLFLSIHILARNTTFRSNHPLGTVANELCNGIQVVDEGAVCRFLSFYQRIRSCLLSVHVQQIHTARESLAFHALSIEDRWRINSENAIKLFCLQIFNNLER